MSEKKTLGFFIGTLIADFVLLFLFSWFLMLLWDKAVVEVFNVPEISYLNTLCLFVMTNIIFHKR